MTEEEYQTRLELLEQTADFFDDDPEADQKRWDYLYSEEGAWALEQMESGWKTPEQTGELEAPDGDFAMDDSTLETAVAPEALQQLPKPQNDELSFPKAEGNIETGITLALDADGDQASKELVLHFKRQGANVVMTVKHMPTETTKKTTIAMESVKAAKGFGIQEIFTTDGVLKLKIKLAPNGEIRIQPPGSGGYAFEFFGVKATNFQLNLKTDKPYTREKTIEITKGPIKEAKYWSTTFKVGNGGDVAKLRIYYDEGGSWNLMGSVSYFAAGSRHLGARKDGKIDFGVKKKLDEVIVKPVYYDPQMIGFVFLDAQTNEPLHAGAAPDFFVAYLVREYAQKEKDKLTDQGEVLTDKPQEYAKVGLTVFNGQLKKPQAAMFGKKNSKVVGKDFEGAMKNDQYNAKRTSYDAIGELHKIEVPPTKSLMEEVWLLEAQYRTLLLALAKKGVIRENTLHAWFELQLVMKSFLSFSSPSAHEMEIAMLVAQNFAQTFHEEMEPKEKKVSYESNLAVNYRQYHNPYSGEKVIQHYSSNAGPLFAQPSTHTVDDALEKEETSALLNNPVYFPPELDMLPQLILKGDTQLLQKTFQSINERYIQWATDQAMDKKNSAAIQGIPGQMKVLAKMKEGLTELGADIAKITTPRKIKAVFYPKEEKTGYENTKPNETLTSFPLQLYYYYHKEKERWYIKNLCTPTGSSHTESTESKGVKGTADQPPKALFDELNDVNHLPKGWIYYQMPDGTMGDQVYVDGKWGWTEWLKAIGIGAILTGLALTGVGGLLGGMEVLAGGMGTIGAGYATVGTVLSVAGGGLVAVSGAREVMDIYQEGRGDAKSYTGAILDVASGLLGTGPLLLPKLQNISSSAGQMVYLTWQTAEAGVNSLSLLLTTEGGARSIAALIQNRKQMSNTQFAGELLWQIAYLAAQDYIAIRTIKGNVADIKAISEARVGVMKVSKGESKAKDYSKRKDKLEDYSKRKDNLEDYSKKEQVTDIAQAQKEAQLHAQQVATHQQEMQGLQQQLLQQETHLATLKKMKQTQAVSEQNLREAQQSLQKTKEGFDQTRTLYDDAIKKQQNAEEQWLRARARQENAGHAIAQQQLNKVQAKALQKMHANSRNMGFSQGRLAEMYHKVKGNVPWNQKPQNLNSQSRKVYEQFQPGETTIRYVQYKNGKVYRIHHDPGGDYIQYANGRNIKVRPKKHQIHEATLSFTYTRHNYPVTVKETGGVYYQGQHNPIYIPKGQRAKLKTELTTTKVN